MHRGTRLSGTLAALAAGLLALGSAPALADGDPPEDLTPPVVRIALTAPEGQWFRAGVAPAVSAVDEGPLATGVREVRYTLSGASTGTGTVPSAGGAQVPITNEGVTRLTVEAWDFNGNHAAAFEDVRIDKTLPAATFTGRLAGASPRFFKGETVAATYTCADSLSGVASCTAPVANGAALDTSTTGTFTISVTARDRAGNTAHSDRRSYEVVEPSFTVDSSPAIDPVAAVGRPPTWFSGGSYTPRPDAVRCGWLRNGIWLKPEDGSLALTQADIGATLALQCTVTKAGFPALVVTSNEVTVRTGWLHLSSPPVLDGIPVPGQVLTAQHGSTGVAGTTYTYSWWRNNTLVPGATGKQYRVTAADAGQRIHVAVTGKAPGYAGGPWVSTARSVLVPDAEALEMNPPSIEGDPVVGEILTAVRGQTGVDWTTYTYAWFRDGVPISGATGSNYLLVPADAGRQVTLTVSASAVGYRPGRWVSAPVTVPGEKVPLDLALTSAPQVSGPRVAGRVLMATHGSTGVSGTTYAYRWYRNGVPITGANGRTYRLLPADAGRRVTVAVSASAAGYNPGRWLSAPTAAVAAASSVVRPTARALGGGRVRITTRVVVVGATATGVVHIRRGSKVVGTGRLRSGVITLTLRNQRPGKVRYAVAYRGATGIRASKATVAVRVR